MKYELHPACAMWPQMADHELKALAEDIQANGQTHAIVLLGNKVLDGRNRMLACELIGVELLTEPYTGSDPVSFVVSANLHRRHLTTSQRGMIGVDIETMRHGGDRKLDQDAKSRLDRPRVEAATLMKVSPRTICSAKTIVKNGTPEQIAAVRAGKAVIGDGISKKASVRASKPGRKPKRAPATYPDKWVPLTREQVDPEFEGTEMEWRFKYQHVQSNTAEGYATDRFSAWALNLRAVAKATKALPDWPVVDLNWLRSPKPGSIDRMAEALNYLRPIIAEAEAMLAKAETTRAQAVVEPTELEESSDA